MVSRHRQMEALVIDPRFWAGRRVYLTGHTGFKGAWTALLLKQLGSDVTGFALPANSTDDLFEAAKVRSVLRGHEVGDIRDLASLSKNLQAAEPEIVLHMAAQALVRLSYDEPVSTYATNVMGTVHLLESVRRVPSVRATVVVTSDKCYENVGWVWGYRENDRLGGRDPYSNSKGCAELVTDSYRNSFFQAQGLSHIATVRAGNVVGGGDWARDRLVPDAIRAFSANHALRIRNPDAVRPWQHVLDPITGYLRLAQSLFENGAPFAEAWNFGPAADSEVPVSTVVSRLARLWGNTASWEVDGDTHVHEAAYLKLDCSKAASRLNWRPAMNLDQTLQLTVDWYRSFRDAKDMRAITMAQIEEFLSGAARAS
jgi:CDP-glucose 4,6-dehydratase